MTPMIIPSCTVKEDRDIACPSQLSIQMKLSPEMFPSEKEAWLSVWDKDMCIHSDKVSFKDRLDTILRYDIWPRRNLDILVSNVCQEGHRFYYLGMDENKVLRANHVSVDCNQSEVSVLFPGLDKQYCYLSLVLNKASYRVHNGLLAEINSPYCGSSIPELMPMKGDYLCIGAFDELGVCRVMLPRQGGPGLSMTLSTAGGNKSTIDLYKALKDLHYNWNDWSLQDIVLEIGLDATLSQISIDSWSYVEMGSPQF